MQNEKKKNQEYVDVFEILNEFQRILEQYDQNLLNQYFYNFNMINLQFSSIFFENLIQKISNIKNIQESNKFQNLVQKMQNLLNKLNNNSTQLLNEEMIKIIQQNQKETKINYGILTEKTENCSLCFKILKQIDDSPFGSNPISLRFCKHLYCRECLRNYILKSTNNLVFLTRNDESNSNRRVIKCPNKQCNFVIFESDYYNIFCETLKKRIEQNYFFRVNSLDYV